MHETSFFISIKQMVGFSDLFSCSIVIISIWFKEVIAIQTGKKLERIYSISINYCLQQLEQETEGEEEESKCTYCFFTVSVPMMHKTNKCEPMHRI